LDLKNVLTPIKNRNIIRSHKWAFKKNYQEKKDVGYWKQAHLHVAILFSTLLILACTKAMRADPPSANYFSVELGQEFELKKGQRAGVAGTGFGLTILNFFNQPCPPGVKCVWSGIGIEFEYRYNGQMRRGVNLAKAFGYTTRIIRSDYESYAVLRVTEDKDG
jgi:hypothetical protein